MPMTQVVVGVVHNPILAETFTAMRSRGALLNGQRISVSGESDVGSALVATEVFSQFCIWNCGSCSP